MYDAALGRFHTIDPLAEWAFSESPYNYVRNNPVSLIDPTGMWPKWWPFGNDEKAVNEGNPEPIQEVVFVGTRKPPSKWRQFWGKVGNALRSGDKGMKGDGDKQPAGYVYTVTDGSGQGGSGTEATEETYGYVDITDWLELSKSAKKTPNYPARPPSNTDYADQAKNLDELSKALTSEKDIKQNNTGPGPETNASGQPITNNGEEVVKVLVKGVSGVDSAGVGKTYYAKDSTSEGNIHYKYNHGAPNDKTSVNEDEFNAVFNGN